MLDGLFDFGFDGLALCGEALSIQLGLDQFKAIPFGWPIAAGSGVPELAAGTNVEEGWELIFELTYMMSDEPWVVGDVFGWHPERTSHVAHIP